jgi:hypothetical protein
VTVNSVVDRSIQRSQLPSLRRELSDARARLSGTLAGILGSRSEQVAIAERSYWHPNGFAKLILSEDPGAGQLRLHVWPEVTSRDDVHGHAWAYESVVVAGELTEITYRDAPSGEGTLMWRHAYGGVGHGRFVMTDATPVHLREAGVHSYTAGDESGGVPDRVHRFFASVTPAATLLRVGPVVDPTSYVYRTTPEPPHLIAPRPTTRREVCTLIDHLAGVVRT